MAELLSVLEKLNKSLGNLNLLHPGDKIIIPLKIVPITGAPIPAEEAPPIQASPTDLKDVDLDNYTVEPGDSLSRVIAGRYDIPKGYLYNEYLGMVKRLNPAIQDLNRILPGQRIRLPVYSPEIVRKPIDPPKSEENVEQTNEDEGDVEAAHGADSVAGDLAVIFAEMGEEWVQTGEHFIPLPSGGQIDLKAASFPILSLQEGLRVIVDVNNKLPDKMARLIESSWGSYRVVHLEKEDSLSSALDKILMVCNYPKITGNEEALELSGDIPLRITGDWIVTLPETRSADSPGFVVINLNASPAPGTPGMIKSYIGHLGVKIIDYPPGEGRRPDGMEKVETLESGADAVSLVSTLLDLVDRSYSSQVEIPIYQKRKADFKLVIKADFFLQIKGRDAIIDVTGLAPEITSLLEEHQFLTLSLAGERDPLSMVSRTLDFLGVQSEKGPHSFLAANRDDSKNVRLTLQGVVFPDAKGTSVLGTPLSLPIEIVAFLSTRAYRVLQLKRF
jgi:hypothetical protein